MHERFGANAKTFLSKSWYPRWVLLGCLLLSVAACSGGLDPEPPALDNPTLLVEGSGESTPEALDGSTVAGTIHVYVESHPRISEVQFFLNDPELLGEPKQTIESEPRLERYVLILDTTALTDGTHTLSVVILVGQGRNNSKVESEATFTVDNSSDGSSDLPGEDGDDGAGFGPWQSTDIGAVGTSGTVEYSEAEGMYTLSVASGDIWGEADSFFFTYQELDGDGEITARVNDLDEVHRSSKAGVMIRSSLAAGASHATMYMNVPSRERAAFAHRSVDSGETTNTPSDAGMPWYVRLVRQGDLVIGYASPDGEDWTEVDSVIIDLPGQVYVGLALSSNDETGVAEAQFDTVAVGDVFSLPSVGIEIDPGTVELGTDETMSFSAEVTGTSNTDVSWSASVGEITADGVYTAPASPGPDLVTATSKADPDKKDTAEVTVVDSDSSPPPGASGDFSLRGDPNFDESQLSDEARMWYRRVWAAIEHPDQVPDASYRASQGSIYYYGRTLNRYLTTLFLAFRATGDLRLLDEVDRLTEIMRDQLTTKWRKEDGTKYDPDDGTDGLKRWLYLRWKHEEFAGKDTHQMDDMLTHSLVATFAYAFWLNKDLTSPAGVDYEERAAFWYDYLKNHFEAKWRIRLDQPDEEPFVFIGNRLTHPYTNFIRFHHYMAQMSGEPTYADEASRMAGHVAGNLVDCPSPIGPAHVYSWGIRSEGSSQHWMKSFMYVSSDITALAEVVLEEVSPEIDGETLQRISNAITQFADDGDPENTGLRFAETIGGDQDRCGLLLNEGHRPRMSLNNWAQNNYGLSAAWDSHGLVDQINDEGYENREADLDNPQRVFIPAVKVLMLAFE